MTMEKETYWSRFAEDFEEKNCYVVGKNDMAHIFEKVNGLKNLHQTLELGCGNGTYSKLLLKNADHLTATDFSDEMVKSVKKRLGAAPNLSIKKANCFDLQFSAEYFDTIFMANLLHVVPEPEKALAECRRVLKNNGRIIIISFTSERMTFFNKLTMIYRYLKSYGKPSPHARTITIRQACDLLTSTGFLVEEAELLGNKMKCLFITAQKQI